MRYEIRPIGSGYTTAGENADRVLHAVIFRGDDAYAAKVGWSSTARLLGTAPGWEYPSIRAPAGSVRAGSGVSGRMVAAPSGMLNRALAARATPGRPPSSHPPERVAMHIPNHPRRHSPVLLAGRGGGEQFDEVAGGVGEQDLASAGA